MELALGWPAGLRILLEAGANPLHATQCAISHCDADSLRLLLSTIKPSLLAHSQTSYLHTVRAAAFRENEKISAQMIDHIKFASGDTDSPPMSQVYAELAAVWTCGPMVLKFLDQLHQSGYKKLDLKGTIDRMTPLYKLTYTCWDIANWEFRIWFKLVNWFLERGADPIFHEEGHLPNVLHRLSKHFANEHLKRVPILEKPWAEDLRRVVKLAFRRCRLTDADGCSCPCSSNGCLLLRQLLRCQRIGHHSEPECPYIGIRQSDLDKVVSDWLQFCDATQEDTGVYYLEAVRLEVFDRLRMTHVCCVMDWETSVQSSLFPFMVISRPDQETCAEIKLEENELAVQLDLIVEAFKQFREKNNHSAEDSLRRWWNLLDPILPETEQDSRCYDEMNGPRHVLVGEKSRAKNSANFDVLGDSKAIKDEERLEHGTVRDMNEEDLGRSKSDTSEGADSSENGREGTCLEYGGEAGIDKNDLEFLDVIVIRFSKILGQGWADNFLSGAE